MKDIYDIAKALYDASLSHNDIALHKAQMAFDEYDATGMSVELIDIMALHDLTHPEAEAYLRVTRQNKTNWRDNEIVPLRDDEGNIAFYKTFAAINNAFDQWVRWHGAAWSFGRTWQVMTEAELDKHNAQPGDVVVMAEVHDSIMRTRYVRDFDQFIEKAKEVSMLPLDANKLWRTTRDTLAPCDTITVGCGVYRAEEMPDPRYGMSRYQIAEKRAKRNAMLARCPFVKMIKEVKEPEPPQALAQHPDFKNMTEVEKAAHFVVNQARMGRHENNPDDLI